MSLVWFLFSGILVPRCWVPLSVWVGRFSNAARKWRRSPKFRLSAFEPESQDFCAILSPLNGLASGTLHSIVLAI